MMVELKVPVIIYALSLCPKCKGKLKNHGVRWVCEKCGWARGRSWVSDPEGRWLTYDDGKLCPLA